MSKFLFSIFPNENFIDLTLYQYGWEQCDPSHSFGPAARNHFLFHYILSGTGVLNANNEKGITKSYQVKSGQGFMIFPHQICTYIADQNLPWEYVWLEFDGLRAKELVDTAGLSCDSPIYRARYKDIAVTMKEEMLYIVTHKEASPFHLIGHLFLFLDSFVSSSASIITKNSNGLRDFYIKEAVAFIEQNFQNPITIEEIAKFCGLNRSYFGKIFHESMGKSPQDFLISYRMTKAAELLKLTSLSIADVGNAVGYENQLHFSRAFKHVYGISPRQWRNEHL
ncbi:MAG: AraC family transcriptional regulator [Lachnospiraceae bacterium]|nr:AraC family transcriptional regulator [Lachnospiraceae bacterium]